MALLWIFTAITSAFLTTNLGFDILAVGGITGGLAKVALYGGSILDAVLGIWLLSGLKLRWCCYVQISVITLYTLLLTVIDASYWLHPFGPLTKNLPLIVLIAIVARQNVPTKVLRKENR